MPPAPPVPAPAAPAGTPRRPAPSSRRERTRERLLDAAYEVFAETGVAAASVEEVCERAGFTRGAFYSNFATKEELFSALLERENGDVLAALGERIDALLPEGDAPPLDESRLGDLVLGLLEGPSDLRRWCLVENEWQLVALRDPEVGRRWVADHDRFMDALVPLVRRAAERAGRRFVLDPDLAVRVVVGVYREGLTEAMLRGAEDPARLRAELAEVVRALTVAA
ncbi:TetR/AcrR family transcriptional regulator [Cellulomonas endophytica]|uniref:TetR/AcrR family transcriptional regulator n=1 Tax=Cellulomonas endophytica TaxID=2494735 RepID=UPI0013E90C30|nr:TetR/AcrR family transcriptional regulator [Cellulomonas endophytica]